MLIAELGGIPYFPHPSPGPAGAELYKTFWEGSFIELTYYTVTRNQCRNFLYKFSKDNQSITKGTNNSFLFSFLVC